MVYFVKSKGTVRVFLAESDMIAAGFKKADLTASEEEYNSNGCYVRLIEGSIIIGKTDDEKAEEERLEKVAEYKSQLEQIDRDAGCGRAFRTIAIEASKLLHKTNPSVETFDPDKGVDLIKIIQAEEAAVPIRAQLAPLLKQAG